MKIYSIANWKDTYETAETRKLENLRWAPVPNKHDGLGFRRLASHRDRCELLAAWVLIVQTASKGRRNERGTLARDGRPLLADDLALMTGFPPVIFEKAFSFFSDPKQGWLTTTADSPSDAASVHEQSCGSPAIPATSPARPADDPGLPGSSPAEGKGREEKRKEWKEKKDVGQSAACPPLIVGDSLQLSDEEKKQPAPSKLTDAEWIDSLRADPAFAEIDVLREHAKATRWCLENRRELTRRRFVNWLNRCDKPTSPQPTDAFGSVRSTKW